MQSIPLAVLKLYRGFLLQMERLLHAIHTACGIETAELVYPHQIHSSLHAIHTACGIETIAPATKTNTATNCMQSIPLAVLKLISPTSTSRWEVLHAIHTACGIETSPRWRIPYQREYSMQSIPLAVLQHKRGCRT